MNNSLHEKFCQSLYILATSLTTNIADVNTSYNYFRGLNTKTTSFSNPTSYIPISYSDVGDVTLVTQISRDIGDAKKYFASLYDREGIYDLPK